MKEYPDLEISLTKVGPENYSLAMTFSRPDSSAKVALLPGGYDLGRLDLQAGQQLLLDPDEYGHWLGRLLFQNGTVEGAMTVALSNAQLLGSPLRIRLVLPDSLQGLCWEAVRLPSSGARLATSENSPLSRFLSSSDLRPVQLRQQSEMRALVVVANPQNLDDYEPGGVQLAPVDVAAELARARTGLGAIQIVELASSGTATLENIRQHSRDNFDILYLVCHGTFAQGNTILWLENEAGTAEPTDGNALVMLLAESRILPRLVVLASCQSAGDGRAPAGPDSSSLAALGPGLAAAGVPAVIGMQGYISMETIARFMPVFFSQLARDGEIDRAMAAARASVKDRADWWMPVLYMRLENGRLRQTEPTPIAAPVVEAPRVNPKPAGPLSRSDRSRLRRQIADHFDLSELVELCFDLDIDFENMSGATKSAKVISLITYAERHLKMMELLEVLAEARPDSAW